MPDDQKYDDATNSRRVRLFRNGRNQAVRIPRDMELPGEEALIMQEGDRLVLVPAGPTMDLLAWVDTLEPIAEDFAEIEDPPPAERGCFDD